MAQKRSILELHTPYISPAKMAKIQRGEMLRKERLDRGGMSLTGNITKLDMCTLSTVDMRALDALSTGEDAVCVVVDIRVPQDRGFVAQGATVIETDEYEIWSEVQHEFSTMWTGTHPTDTETVLCHCVCNCENGGVHAADIVFKIVASTANNITHYLDREWLILTGPPRAEGVFFKALSDFIPLLA